ncbi:hypothetical protein K438DRAFT_884694 [Mycena galopus ATCC 62051]|nr:hypothetical protein K438DRAFT_884694 [Mycena galopus ATCC 62051]
MCPSSSLIQCVVGAAVPWFLSWRVHGDKCSSAVFKVVIMASSKRFWWRQRNRVFLPFMSVQSDVLPLNEYFTVRLSPSVGRPRTPTLTTSSSFSHLYQCQKCRSSSQSLYRDGSRFKFGNFIQTWRETPCSVEFAKPKLRRVLIRTL